MQGPGTAAIFKQVTEAVVPDRVSAPGDAQGFCIGLADNDKAANADIGLRPVAGLSV